jgi:hypothetical protein
MEGMVGVENKGKPEASDRIGKIAESLEHFSCSCELEEVCECRFSWGKTTLRFVPSVYTHRRNALAPEGRVLEAVLREGLIEACCGYIGRRRRWRRWTTLLLLS